MRFYIDWLLTPEQRSALIGANVDFSEISLGTAVYHRHGLTFPEEAADVVTATLGLLRDSDEFAEHVQLPGGQSIDNLRSLPLTPLPGPGNPVVGVSELGSTVDLVYAQHYDSLQLGMVLSDSCWESTEYCHRPGVLFVHHRSIPSGMRHTSGEDSRGGTRLNPERVSRTYFSITNDNRERLALFRGDAAGGSLWFLVNPNNHRNGDELVDYVLSTVERRLRPEIGPRVTYKEFMRLSARRRYLRSARQRLEEEMAAVDDRVENGDRSANEARQGLVSALREANAARRRREALTTTDEATMLTEITERLSREFDLLMDSPDFESIEHGRGCFKVQTRPIVIEYEGIAYEFGRYLIEVETVDLRITSVDGVHADRNTCHPHVNGQRACLGNLSEGVAKLQASMQYDVLLPLLVRYLETGYNPDDSYAQLSQFNVRTRELEVAT